MLRHCVSVYSMYVPGVLNDGGCCDNVFQVEGDLGYPGRNAKIIHKESDIIMAFAINRVRDLCSAHRHPHTKLSHLMNMAPECQTTSGFRVRHHRDK